MLADELPQPIRSTGRRRLDRLAVEMTQNIEGETVDSLVASRPVFLQGFHHDPVEIPAQLAFQTLRIDPRLAAMLGKASAVLTLVLGFEGSTSRTIRSISRRAPRRN